MAVAAASAAVEAWQAATDAAEAVLAPLRQARGLVPAGAADTVAVAVDALLERAAPLVQRHRADGLVLCSSSSLGWLPPPAAAGGELAVTGYVVQQKLGAGGAWAEVARAAAGEARAAVADVFSHGAGSFPLFRVAALNRAGRGPWSEELDSKKGFSVHAAPSDDPSSTQFRMTDELEPILSARSA